MNQNKLGRLPNLKYQPILTYFYNFLKTPLIISMPDNPRHILFGPRLTFEPNYI